MEITEDSWGLWLKNDELTILFGGKNSSIQKLEENFKNISFRRVKQVHGDTIVQAQKDLIEADAHIGVLSEALCISTADCSPVMLYDSKRKVIAAIHAGWRGVENKIVPKTIARLVREGTNPKDIQVYIGPHIQKQSFEVKNDVRDLLLKSTGLDSADLKTLYSVLVTEISNEKSLVDLNQILKIQIDNEGVDLEKLFCLHIDTMTDQRFHSHRRDKENAGRQISFITQSR